MFKHPMMVRAFYAPETGGAAGGGTSTGQPPAGAPPAGAEHPATAPWSGSQDVWKVGEAGKEQPWYHAITEEPVRELMKAKNYKNPAELAMAYHNANKMINNPDAIVMPKADAKPEEWNAFYTKLGRPETADKYEFKHADGVTPNEALTKLGKELFFDLGASPAKAQAAMDKWDKAVMAMNTALQAENAKKNDDALAALNTKWGAELEVNKASGLRAVKSLIAKGATPELIAKVEEHIGAASVVELLALLGKASGEGDGTKGGGGHSNADPNDTTSMSKEQAAARIKALQADDAFQKKYTDKNNPEHASALSLMEKLYAKAG